MVILSIFFLTVLILFPNPKIVCFSDGESLLTDTGEKDILFLDIEMPGINGIYIGNELKRANDNIIIFVVTSYSEYLDDAMRFHVFRYLSKPLDIHRFFRNMKDAIDLYNTMTINLPIETKQGVRTLPASSVIAVEALTSHKWHNRQESRLKNRQYPADFFHKSPKVKPH